MAKRSSVLRSRSHLVWLGWPDFLQQPPNAVGCITTRQSCSHLSSSQRKSPTNTGSVITHIPLRVHRILSLSCCPHRQESQDRCAGRSRLQCRRCPLWNFPSRVASSPVPARLFTSRCREELKLPSTVIKSRGKEGVEAAGFTRSEAEPAAAAPAIAIACRRWIRLAGSVANGSSAPRSPTIKPAAQALATSHAPTSPSSGGGGEKLERVGENEWGERR
uniref:Uncharacterized protein n=1 Tax=Oryza meridionalis TaxID=40149 RepID=A0A0E0FC42_9ORYZ